MGRGSGFGNNKGLGAELLGKKCPVASMKFGIPYFSLTMAQEVAHKSELTRQRASEASGSRSASVELSSSSSISIFVCLSSLVVPLLSLAARVPIGTETAWTLRKGAYSLTQSTKSGCVAKCTSYCRPSALMNLCSCAAMARGGWTSPREPICTKRTLRELCIVLGKPIVVMDQANTRAAY